MADPQEERRRSANPLRRLGPQLVLLVLAVALPLAALTSYLLYGERRQAYEDAQELVREVVRDVGDDTVAFLAMTEERLIYLAGRPLVRALDPARCDPAIVEIQRANSTHPSIILVDATGRVVCWAFEQAPAGTSFADREWFQQGLVAGAVRAGIPVFGRVSKQLSVPFTAPVLDKHGAPAGVLTVATSLKEISRLVESRRLPAGSMITVVSRDGTIVARSADAAKWLGEPASKIPALAEQKARRNGIGVLTGIDGVERINAFITLPGLEWLVSAAVPVDSVLARHEERLRQTLVVSLIVIATVLAGALAWAARIRRPIESLDAAARAVAQGRFDIPAIEQGPAEVVAVAREFNRMQAARARVEAHLKERTLQLEAANRELEAFAYSVSHDLRAPLRAVDGFSQALLEDYAGILDEEGKDNLRRVREASQRMAVLIDDMLKLSRATRVELDLGVVDLSAAAATTAKALQAAAPERRVRVVVQSGLRVRGDARLMSMVLDNLLTNAWKFTARRDEALIEVSGEQRDGELVCHVRDNGAGFDMAYAGALFSPFQRLHRTSEFPGNGIGLATVKRVLARLGGRVWAEAKVNEGATFHFTLPLAAP